MKINKFLAVPVVVAMLALSFGWASAQTAMPRVALQFASNGLTNPLTAGGDDAVIARLLLDTTGSTEAVRIQSLPFNVIAGNGASASTLGSCRVYNESDTNSALNSSTGSLSSGLNNIGLSNALVLPANTMTTLSLQCDIANDLASGGTYTVNMNTSSVVATGATTGTTAVVTVRGAGVPTTPTTPTTPNTPGLPTTGAGGEAAQNIAMLIASILMAGLGFSYLTRRNA
jgi:hypothetical protein